MRASSLRFPFMRSCAASPTTTTVQLFLSIRHQSTSLSSSSSAAAAPAASSISTSWSSSLNTTTTANNAGVEVADMSPSTSEGKVVVFGGDAREMMLAGIERIAKAVSVTLGPKGRNVVIRLPNGDPKITKDGVTVARSISFKNQFEDVGAKLVRQVASKTNDVAGDGTTTATVLAWSIFGEGYKAVATGANPMDLKRGIDTAVAVVLKSLKEQTRRIGSLEELKNVATISANGERRLGEMIAGAVQSVGVKGFISVTDGRGPQTEWQRHEGWSTEAGFVDSAIVTDTATLSTELGGGGGAGAADGSASCLVLVSTGALTHVDHVMSALEIAVTEKKPLIIAAAAVGADALETILLNHTRGVVQCCVVVPQKNAGSRLGRVEDVLEDLAACCGCSAVSLDTLARLQWNAKSVLGTASRVTQTMDSSEVVGTADVSSRIRFLEKKLERCTEELERDGLRARIAKLNKTFAVVRVGGQTVVEINESKDRVIDALNAARAALTDGIVAGGGAALLHASKKLDQLMREDEDMSQDRRTGIFIVRNAIRLPMRTIGDNAGVEGAVVVQSVLEEESEAMGYDAQNGEYTDMFAAGIVDPTRVVECCVVDAASVAGLKITTEAIVCDDTGLVPQPLMCETVSLLSNNSR